MSYGCAGSRCSSGLTGAEPISGSRWTAARLRGRGSATPRTRRQLTAGGLGLDELLELTSAE
jgi:hypothetical protein